MSEEPFVIEDDGEPKKTGPRVAAIRLSPRSFCKYYDLNSVEMESGDVVIVEDPQLTEVPGRVEMLKPMSDYQLEKGEFPRVLRKASDREAEQFEDLDSREQEALRLAKDTARRLNLDMKISNVRFDDRQRRAIFYFTAEQRVDFRQMVRDLASELKARIELWQVGVRDEARALHGFGVCGLELCCASWIKDFKPVSIRQAKDQDLMLSPAKLSGQCGRLLCCLTYEHQQYKDAAKAAPNVSAICRLKDGTAVALLDRNVLMGKAMARDRHGRNQIISFDDIEKIVGKAPPSALRPDGSEKLANMLAEAEGVDASKGSTRSGELKDVPKRADRRPSKRRPHQERKETDPSKPLEVRPDDKQQAAASDKPEDKGDQKGEDSNRSRRRRRPRSKRRGDSQQKQTQRTQDSSQGRGHRSAKQPGGDDKSGKPDSSKRSRGRRSRRRRPNRGGSGGGENKGGEGKS